MLVYSAEEEEEKVMGNMVYICGQYRRRKQDGEHDKPMS